MVFVQESTNMATENTEIYSSTSINNNVNNVI